MDEDDPATPAEAQPPAATAPDDGAAASGKPGLSARLKAWSDAVTAVAKAALFVLAIGIVAAIAGTAIYRDQRTRHVDVSIDAQTREALQALGAEVDLREAFVDALNERVRGVESIVSLDYSHLIDTADATSVSFKPFGLDTTTGELNAMVRDVLGTKPAPSIRVELRCTPQPCDAARTAILVTTLSSDGRSERIDFPLVTTPTGLQRNLRVAMQRVAERLLERVEPLIASVYALNAGSQGLFGDLASHDLQRAAGLALKLRDPDGAVSCIGNLVLANSLILRGDSEDGLAVSRRAYDAGDALCQIHAATNYIALNLQRVCAADEPVRRQAMAEAAATWARIAGRSSMGVGSLAYNRIPAVEMELRAVNLLMRSPGDDDVRVAFCARRRVERAGSNDDIERGIAELLRRVRLRLPKRTSQQYVHGTLDLVARIAEFGIDRRRLLARYATGEAIRQTIDAFQPFDPHPRRLLIVRGRLAMERADTAADAARLPLPEQIALLRSAGIDTDGAGFDPVAFIGGVRQAALDEARVDFESALATDSVASLVEPSPDIESLMLLGDAQWVAGRPDAARDAYARGVDTFIASDHPIDEIFFLADVVARLEILHASGGHCADDAVRASIDPRWRRVGLSIDDVCSSSDAAAPPTGLTALIRPLVSSAVAACLSKALPSAGRPPDRFALRRCLESSGPFDPEVLQRYRFLHSGRSVDAAIEVALAAAP